MAIGKAAEEMHYLEDDVFWQGLPLSVSEKNYALMEARNRNK